MDLDVLSRRRKEVTIYTAHIMVGLVITAISVRAICKAAANVS
jgi:hypothetical protein